MERVFQAGETISDTLGERYTILSKLGAGGQGDVYRVRASDNKEYALKWYHEDRYLRRINAKRFRENLVRNIQAGKPQLAQGDVANQFIWPKRLVSIGDGFGYIMDLYQPGFESFDAVVMGKKYDKAADATQPVRFRSYYALVTAALNIVRGFEILHAKGYSYQDINGGGFFINPQTGDVLICDCDNVAPDKDNMGIQGIVTYMAPEVVCGKTLPNAHTDRYSMAVILFRLFYRDHPMLGIESSKIMQNPALDDNQKNSIIYGAAPHYCLSRSGQNRPRPNRDVLKMYPLFPKVLLSMFSQVFEKGALDPTARPTDTHWMEVLLSVRDSLVLVNGKEQFFDIPVPKPLPDNCRTLVNQKYRRRVRLMPNKILYGYHATSFGVDFKTPVAKVVAAPGNPKILGLVNGMNAPIRFTTPKGQTAECAPGKTIALVPGMKLLIGNVEYTVA